MKLTLILFAAIFIQTNSQCWEGHDFAKRLYDSEIQATENDDTSRTRTYQMCKNNVAKMATLTLWNPNIEILCGSNGESENNCTFTGGSVHVNITGAETIRSTFAPVEAENINIEGFKFTKVVQGNIYLNNAEGTKLTVKNCIFHDNDSIDIIKLSSPKKSRLNVKNSDFLRNNLRTDITNNNNAIINVRKRAILSIDKTSFRENILREPFKANGEAAIIYFASKNFESDIVIRRSTFVKNEGMTDSLVSGLNLGNTAEWTSESFNNIQGGNKFTQAQLFKICRGIRIKNGLLNEKRKCLEEFQTTSSPTISPVPTLTPPSCWGEDFTSMVMDAEDKITDTSINRVYKMCAGTTIKIAKYDYDEKEFQGIGQKALSIWHPNVIIMCDDLGESNSNCVFTGGTFQIEILSANAYDNEYSSSSLGNIVIQGFTFTNVTDENVLMYNSDRADANIVIKDCVFRDNMATAIIDVLGETGVQIYIENTKFQDNTLIHNEEFPNIGLVNVQYGGDISIHNSQFLGNKFYKNEIDSGSKSLIYFGGIPFPEYKTVINIQKSSFMKNEGMSDALVTGGYLYDDDYTSSDNFEFGNIFSNIDTIDSCQGISRVRKKDTSSYGECIVLFQLSSTPTLSFVPSLIPSSAQPTVSNKPTEACWDTDFTEKVMDAESSVTDVSTPRTYRMCNNAVAKINAWNDENEVFDDDMGKMNGLSIYNSNVNIICGNDEDEIKNCTFDGGTFQIEVYSKEYYVSVKNVNIHGFKFIHASEGNIMIYGADVEKTGLDPLGASIFIKDCVFLDNAVLATIKLRENYNTHLTVENSIFKTNKLIESYGTYNNSHAGIITSNVGGKIDISNSKFIDNDVETADYSNGIRAIVYAIEENADYSGNQHETYLSISNSTFLGNKGITYALIVGGLWNDGKLFESNNYESKNQPLLECYGIGRFTLDFDDYYDYYYNYYYDYDVLLKTQCVAAFSNTGSILTPEVNQALTQVPTQIPTKKDAMPIQE